MAASPADFPVDPRVEKPEDGDARSQCRGTADVVGRTQRPDAALRAASGRREMVTLSESGVFRGHRMLALQFNPVQVDAARGLARIARRIKMRVRLPRQQTADVQPPARPPRGKRPRAPHAGPARPHGAGDTHARGLFGQRPRPGRGHPRRRRRRAIGGRWKLIVRERSVVRVTAEALRFAGCPVDQITPSIPISAIAAGKCRSISPAAPTAVLTTATTSNFYGAPNELTYQASSPAYHNDRWTDDNVYWLSWGNGVPGLRLGDEDGSYHSEWPCRTRPPSAACAPRSISRRT